MKQDKYIEAWEEHTIALRRIAYSLPNAESKNKLYACIETIEGLIKEASQFVIEE